MTDDPIERYLDELFRALRRNAPREARSLLTEAESHIRDAAEAAQQRGMEKYDAEVEAVQRFGDAHRIAAFDRNRDGTRLVVRTALSAWALGSIGAMAVGASGLVAGVFRLAGASDQFIAGTRSTASLQASDCARWLAAYPHTWSCAQAAMADWAAEVVGYRIAAGVVGLVAFAILVFARRRSTHLRRWASLPATVVDTIATTTFAIAGVWLTGLGVDAILQGSSRGAGSG